MVLAPLRYFPQFLDTLLMDLKGGDVSQVPVAARCLRILRSGGRTFAYASNPQTPSPQLAEFTVPIIQGLSKLGGEVLDPSDGPLYCRGLNNCQHYASTEVDRATESVRYLKYTSKGCWCFFGPSDYAGSSRLASSTSSSWRPCRWWPTSPSGLPA